LDDLSINKRMTLHQIIKLVHSAVKRRAVVNTTVDTLHRCE
jgi:hypothetical protein